MRKILRNDTEVALDEVTEHCRLAVDHYRTVATMAHDPELGRLFRDLEQKRSQWAEALEAEIRRMGNLPSVPDGDREAVEHLVIRIRAALSADERVSLLHESDRVEKELVEKARAALEEELPAGARALVQKISEESAGVRERLNLLGA